MNKYGEVAQLDDYVLVVNGGTTTRAYGKTDLARKVVFYGRVIDVSPNGNPLVRVFGVGSYWFSHRDWRLRAPIRVGMLDFPDHNLPDMPKTAIGLVQREMNRIAYANVKRHGQEFVERPRNEPPAPEPVRGENKYSHISAAVRDGLHAALLEGVPTEVTVACIWDGRPVLKFAVCHAFMSKVYKDNRDVPVMWTYPNFSPDIGVVLQKMRKGVSKARVAALLDSKDEEDQRYVQYVKFLCDDPVVSQAWVNPRLEEVLLYGFECDMSCPHVIAMMAVTASRLHYEYPYRVEVWSRLVELGCHPRTALVLQGGVTRDSQYKPFGHGHQIFDCPSIAPEEIRAFRDNNLPVMSEEERAPFKNGFKDFCSYWANDEGVDGGFLCALEPLGKMVERENNWGGGTRMVYVPKMWGSFRDLAEALHEATKELI